MKQRDFLAAALALNIVPNAIAPAQQAAVPIRTAKTTRLFKSPGLYPNALSVMTDAPGGLWIGQQKIATAASAQNYGLPIDADPDEAAWLVDWNGKLLRTVTTHSRNT